MTTVEKNEIIAAVLAALQTNSMTISQLTEITQMSDEDYIELSGGRKVTYANFMAAALAAYVTLDTMATYDTTVAKLNAEKTMLYWQKAPIVMLDSMGATYDNADGGSWAYSPVKGDLVYDSVGHWLGSITTTGSSAYGEGIHPSNRVVYINKHTGFVYTWNSTNSVFVQKNGLRIINDLVTGGEESALSAEMGKELAEDLEAIIDGLYTEETTVHTQTINITDQAQDIPEDAEEQTCQIDWGEIEQDSVPGFTNCFTSGTMPTVKGAQATKTIIIQGNEFDASRTLNNKYLAVFHVSSAASDIALTTSLISTSGNEFKLYDSSGNELSSASNFGADCWLVRRYTYDGSGGNTNPKIAFANNGDSYKTLSIDKAYLIDLTALYGASIPSLSNILADYGFLDLTPGNNYAGSSGNTVVITSKDANGDTLDTATYPDDTEIDVVGGGSISLTGEASPSIDVEWTETELVPVTGTTPDADEVPYNNSESELHAEDVQGAIDEVAAKADAAMAAAENASGGTVTAFQRNKGRGSVLFSQANYYTQYSGGGICRLPQFLIVADNHNTNQTIVNAVDMANNFRSIMGLFQLGDLRDGYKGITASAAGGLFDDCNKPVFTVIGNHDTGLSTVVNSCPTNAELYAAYIKPMVDKMTGWTWNGDEGTITVSFGNSGTQNYRSVTLKCWFDKTNEKKCYWYRDIAFAVSTGNVRVMRIIGLNQYDYPEDSADIITGDNYNFRKGNTYVSSEQAVWLKDVLGDVSSGMSVLVLAHEQLSNSDATNTSLLKWYGGYNNNVVTMQETSVLYEVLNAYVNRTAFTNKAIDLKSDYESSGLSSYTLTCDFTGANGVLCPLLVGHGHKDSVSRNGSLTTIMSINSGKHTQFGDIFHGFGTSNNNTYNGDITDDCLNVVTFDPDHTTVKLCKLGATYTVYGYHRDEEEFDWTTFATPVYGDKQVKEKIDDLE